MRGTPVRALGPPAKLRRGGAIAKAAPAGSNNVAANFQFAASLGKLETCRATRQIFNLPRRSASWKLAATFGSSNRWAESMARADRVSEVAGYIEQAILSGKWSPGDVLPSEREISAEIVVSRSGVRTGLRRRS